MHTIIRDVKTNRDDFIFYSQRLFRILIEEALSELPFELKTVITPIEQEYQGRALKNQVCGVSVIRAGGALENAFHHIQKDVSIGKILIQTDVKTGEPQLHYCHLPKDISSSKVLLMDATIATGAAAMMAVRVLLDHGVPEESIVFVSLIATPQGLHGIAYAFPKVKIVVSEVDPGLNKMYHITPGIGGCICHSFPYSLLSLNRLSFLPSKATLVIASMALIFPVKLLGLESPPPRGRRQSEERVLFVFPLLHEKRKKEKSFSAMRISHLQGDKDHSAKR